MRPKIRAIEEILDLETVGFDEGSQERQARFRVHGMHGLELTLQVRNDDVAGVGLVKDDPDSRRIDPWHIGGGGEDPLAGGIVQARIQTAESGTSGNKVHDNPDPQRLEGANGIGDDQDFVEEALVRIQDPLCAGAPADVEKPLVETEPAALASCDDKASHCPPHSENKKGGWACAPPPSTVNQPATRRIG